MKNINLGYKWIPSFKGIESVNLYVSVSNVFTISGYSWFDPDVNSFGSDSSRRGVDMFSYPSSRTFSFGLQCTFYRLIQFKESYEKDYIKISHIVVGGCGCMLLRQPVGRESIRFCFS